MPTAKKKPTEPGDGETKQTDALMDDALRDVRETLIKFERKRTVDRLRRGRERARAIYGRCEGQKPYGHYPAEAPVLAAILTLRGEGMHCHTIAETLAGRGISSRSGGTWSGPVIAKILRRFQAGAGRS